MSAILNIHFFRSYINKSQLLFKHLKMDKVLEILK